MLKLVLWNDYTREEVHAIFSPDTSFTPQSGTWGLQGMVRVPARRGDWVFFVTFGKQQGDHIFDESITEDGVLSWQSQPAQRLTDTIIQELIQHDDRINNVYLFLRTADRKPYSYLGTLGYLTHDNSREMPVHFQWQLLDWPAPDELLQRAELVLVHSEHNAINSTPSVPHGLVILPTPAWQSPKQGVPTESFRKRKSPDYAAQDAKNRALGIAGEQLVYLHEKSTLTAAGRKDLADQVTHVAAIEGDGAGYDIRSFEIDGRVRYIEVKTTRGNAVTDFFISPNEIAFGVKNSAAYFLFRLYDFDDKKESANAYILHGDISMQLNLFPTAFRAKLLPVDSTN